MNQIQLFTPFQLSKLPSSSLVPCSIPLISSTTVSPQGFRWYHGHGFVVVHPDSAQGIRRGPLEDQLLMDRRQLLLQRWKIMTKTVRQQKCFWKVLGFFGVTWYFLIFGFCSETNKCLKISPSHPPGSNAPLLSVPDSVSSIATT